MTVIILYVFICYMFTLGTWIEHTSKTKDYSLKAGEIALMLLSPVVLPLFLGMHFEEKDNQL
jgi:hypothetical protein